jgi:hypothetical protein
MRFTPLLVLVTALLIPAAQAKANTYDVYSCWAGANTFRNPNASSAAWAKDQSSAGGHYATGDDCGTNSASGSMNIESLLGDLATRGQSAELTFTAPAGTTLAGANLWRRAWTYGSGAGAASQRSYLMTLTNGASLSYDADGGSDVPYGTRGSGPGLTHGIASSNLLTLNLTARAPSRLAYRVGCGFDAGCPTASASGPAPNYSASGVEIFGAIVSVTDAVAPSVWIGDSGLFDGTVNKGIRPVVVQAANDVSGIKKLEVFADENTVPIGVIDYEEDLNKCNWALPVPCQNASNIEIPVDTRQLSDGEHSIIVKAFDAADNEKASTTHYATISNAVVPTDPAPTDPTPTDPAPTDPTPNDPSPSKPGSPDGAGLPNGIGAGAGADATGTMDAAKLTVAFEQNNNPRLKARYGRLVTVHGHLRDGAGGVIANAQVDYSALVTRPGARIQDLGAVRTDTTGAFSLRVATKLGSRQLRFAYRPQLGGAVAANAEVQLDVLAPVSLKVGPKHVRNKRAVVFRGKLGAGPIPRKGKVVNLQVVVDGHWHTFATVRSTKAGTFKYRYRFRRTYGRVTYRFRARSRYEAAYPFIAGSSKTVRVRVN